MNPIITLDSHLKLERCPHCSIDRPNLTAIGKDISTVEDNGANQLIWRIYSCSRCGGLVSAYGFPDRVVRETFPKATMLDSVLPSKVKAFLQQAIDSTHAPSGAIMLCASSVDSMLKEKGYKEGNLYKRIESAVNKGLITEDMGKWAHQVRLEANDERHADDDAILPTVEQARQTIEFTKTLADLLFVLPSKVSRGIEASKDTKRK